MTAHPIMQKLFKAASSNFASLAAPTFISQIIVVICIPIITRIYPPDIYAPLAVLMAFTVIFGLVAPLGLDFAVPVVKCDVEARHLANAAIVMVVISSATIGFISTFIPTSLATPVLGVELASRAPWLIGIAVAGTALVSILEPLQLRVMAYRSIGYTRLIQALVGIASQIVLGNMHYGTAGLITSYLIMLWTPCVIHLYLLISRRELEKFCLVRITSAISLNKNFIKYTTFEALTNALAVHAPILILTFGNVSSILIAHLSLGNRILLAPAYLIAKTGSQIVQGSMRQWDDDLRLGAVVKEKFYLSLSVLIPAGLLGMVVMIIFAPIFLGGAWADSGLVIASMIPGVVLYMISLPLLPIGYLKNRNRQLMLITGFLATVRIGMCFMALPFSDTFAAFMYVLGAVVQYGILTVYLFQISVKN